jgi:hypothetical protein
MTWRHMSSSISLHNRINTTLSVPWEWQVSLEATSLSGNHIKRSRMGLSLGWVVAKNARSCGRLDKGATGSESRSGVQKIQHDEKFATQKLPSLLIPPGCATRLPELLHVFCRTHKRRARSFFFFTAPSCSKDEKGSVLVPNEFENRPKIFSV